MPEIILASASPRRKQLLKGMDLKFTVIPSRVKETIHGQLSPSQLVKKLALAKAQEVAKRCKNKDALIIGADTVVVVKGEILGKPRNKKHARQILTKLSGVNQYVYTGIAVVGTKNNKSLVDYEKTRVKMKKLKPEEIKFHSGKHLDKAGAYAVQEQKDELIEEIEGCYYNVVGLPVNKLKQMLKKLKKQSII